MRFFHHAPLIAAAALLLSTVAVSAQARYAGYAPGTYTAAGLTGSVFHADYGQREVGGIGLFVDGHLYRRIGIEGSYRILNLHTSEDVRQTTYLVGPRLSHTGPTFRPYARLLAGRAHMTFPFNLATGNYFVLAPGAGLDIRLGQTPWTLRALDVEYQLWPQFTFGQLHPYGLNSGISYTFYALHPKPSHY